MTDPTPAIINEYTSAHENAILVDSNNRGCFRLTGETRFDLIDRLSTNDINSLKIGSGLGTVLTNHQARIIDRITVFNRGKDLLLLTSPNAGPVVQDWLKNKIFFNDDVQLEDIWANDIEAKQGYASQLVDLLRNLSEALRALHRRPDSSRPVLPHLP